MPRMNICFILLFYVLLKSFQVQSVPTFQLPISAESHTSSHHDISAKLFADLEELSRIVDISYCVGLTGIGIQKPFQCASRCHEFPGFELATTWNTGPFFSDSCGYIALSHPPSAPRIIVAFRGTYSITNTIIDMSTIPQKYIPYPGDEDHSWVFPRAADSKNTECLGCTVHLGFMTSWRQTRPYLMPHLEELVKKYPGYQLTLVGHSLGGAVAALASLDFHSRGWNPQITTFGEPRIGNLALMQYIDKAFMANKQTNVSDMYRRVTHAEDPVPLLPISEWGYRMHAGEIYISKPDLSPSVKDLYSCEGDEDPQCIARAEASSTEATFKNVNQDLDLEHFQDWWNNTKGFLEVPARFRVWQLFFAHRDYFWRLGLCVPGGDPKDWHRIYHEITHGGL